MPGGKRGKGNRDAWENSRPRRDRGECAVGDGAIAAIDVQGDVRIAISLNLGEVENRDQLKAKLNQHIVAFGEIPANVFGQRTLVRIQPHDLNRQIKALPKIDEQWNTQVQGTDQGRQDGGNPDHEVI